MKVISSTAIVRKPLVATTDGRSTKAISTDSRSTKNYDYSSYTDFTLFLPSVQRRYYDYKTLTFLLTTVASINLLTLS